MMATTATKQQDIAMEEVKAQVEFKATLKPEEATKKEPQHQFIKDKLLIRVAIVIFFLLCISWSVQWASVILPAWRGDEYHRGGLFEICGNCDLQLNKTTYQLYPGPLYEWKCEPFNDYVDRFAKIYEGVPGDGQKQALHAKTMIVVSRWFEVTSTSLDMIFGVTTIWAIVYPHIDRKKQIRNMQFALVGILLTPTFTLLDSFIQNTYWAMIGVGYFEKRGIQNFLYASGDMNWASSFTDFALQLGFLCWGVRRQYVLSLQGDEVAARGVV